jgi:uncharacterized protein YggL (DUF469 family)
MSAPCPVYGFVVSVVFDARTTDAQRAALMDDLIDTLEAGDLLMGGRGDRVLEYVINREGDQATEADRQRVLAWAARWSESGVIMVSDLVDLSEAVGDNRMHR